MDDVEERSDEGELFAGDLAYIAGRPKIALLKANAFPWSMHMAVRCLP